MQRLYLQCDICGDKWDITDTDLSKLINPGLRYNNNEVRKGVRQFKIVRQKAVSDNSIICDDLDICNECYNKLDRFIYELAKGEEK